MNKPGVLEHPISVCTGKFGSLYTADYTIGIQILSRDNVKPTCVIYSAGVIYIAEQSCVSYVDVGNATALNPKALKKARLRAELGQRKLLRPGEKATVAEMRQHLSDWIKDNVLDVSRENGVRTLIGEISPLASICGRR